VGSFLTALIRKAVPPLLNKTAMAISLHPPEI